MPCYLCNDLGFIAPLQAFPVAGRPTWIAHEPRPPDHEHPVLPCPACAVDALTRRVAALEETLRVDDEFAAKRRAIAAADRERRREIVYEYGLGDK